MRTVNGEPHEPPTEALVLWAQRGDPTALERLVERYLAALTRFCWRLAGAQGGAEGTTQDLVQETLLRMVVSLGRVAEPARFEAWLFGIAANVARKRWRHERQAPLSLERAMAHPDAEWMAVRPLWETPQAEVEREERAREVEQAVGGLPGAMGRVVVLHYADGLSYAEIAAELGVPVSTIKGRLFKSRRRLRLALGSAERAPRKRGARKERTMTSVQTRSHDAERLIAVTEERVARAVAFYGHWFDRELGIAGLTEDAKEVLRRATAESEAFRHTYLGTEHLLLGLLGDDRALPATVLAACGVRLGPVREMLQYRIGRGTAPVEGTIGLVPRVKTVVELSLDEARRRGAEAVGAEHLLLGLLREGCGIAAL